MKDPSRPEDREVYSPEMSLREYWDWAATHDRRWRRGMEWGTMIGLIFFLAMIVIGVWITVS